MGLDSDASDLVSHTHSSGQFLECTDPFSIFGSVAETLNIILPESQSPK